MAAPAAPAASHFFASILGRLDTALATYVDQGAGHMIDWAVPIAAKLLVIYFALWGYALWRGMVQEPVKDGSFRILKAAIIIGLVDLSSYHTYVADFFLGVPDELAAAVTGAPRTASIQFLDSLWDQLYAFGDAFWQKGTAAGLSGVGLVVFGLLVWGAGLLATGGAAVLLLLAKFGVAVWLAVGPLFILLALFDATKQFTNSWLGQTITFALLPLLTGAVVKLLLSLLQSYMQDAIRDGALADPATNQAIPAFALCGFALVVLKQIPSFASGLGGGVAISTLGAVGAAANAMKGGMGSTGNLLSGRTLNHLRAERKHKAQNAEWAKNNPGLTARAAGLPMAAYRKLTSPGKNTVANNREESR